MSQDLVSLFPLIWAHVLHTSASPCLTHKKIRKRVLLFKYFFYFSKSTSLLQWPIPAFGVFSFSSLLNWSSEAKVNVTSFWEAFLNPYPCQNESLFRQCFCHVGQALYNHDLYSFPFLRWTLTSMEKKKVLVWLFWAWQLFPLGLSGVLFPWPALFTCWWYRITFLYLEGTLPSKSKSWWIVNHPCHDR